MTRTFCEDCRERFDELIAAEESASASNGGVQSSRLQSDSAQSDLDLLRAHLQECEQCARELRLLKNARRALRAFEPLPAPASLAAGIRAELEKEAAAQANGTAQIKPHARIEQSAATPEYSSAEKSQALAKPKKFKPIKQVKAPPPPPPPGFLERALAFFSNPANSVWAGGMAATTILLVVALQPRPSSHYTAPAFETQEEALENETILRQEKGAPAKSARAPGSTASPAAPKAGQPAVPTTPVPPSAPTPSFSVPDWRSWWPRSSPPPSSPPSENLLPEPAPSAKAPTPPAARPKSSTPPSTAPADKAAKPSAPGPAGPAGNTTASEREQPRTFAFRDEGKNQTVRSAPAPAASGSMPAELRRAPEENASAESGLAAAAKSDARIAADEAAPARQRKATARENTSTPANTLRDTAPITRFVTVKLTPPRNVSWAQLSVSLSGDATFADGGKRRVLWRGNALAGEAIEVGFSVTAPPGSHSARLTLQEVKNGEAQTVATRNASFSVR